ncbi:MAG: hypothetical protein WC725_02400 [Patescibacteria group bacterium]|jgi:hypothetical protein
MKLINLSVLALGVLIIFASQLESVIKVAKKVAWWFGPFGAGSVGGLDSSDKDRITKWIIMFIGVFIIVLTLIATYIQTRS